MYQEQFPNRRIPHPDTFIALHRRLGEIGQLTPLLSSTGRARGMQTVNIEENIIQHITDDPPLSTRRLAAQLQVSHFLVWKTLFEAGLYPYKHFFQEITVLAWIFVDGLRINPIFKTTILRLM